MKTAYLLLLTGIVLESVNGQTVYPETISRPGIATISASGNSFIPSLSSDRRFVVFLSSSPNLNTNENLSPYLDVYRHDLLTGENVLISRGAQPMHGANADSSAASVSSNGQSIAFASRASDLLALTPDANNASDIFLSTGPHNPCSLISADFSGNSPANAIVPRSSALSDNPHISADGLWVAFQSFATNLTSDRDLNNHSDVFIRDTLSNKTYLVSIAIDGAGTAFGKSDVAAISPEGNYVLFTSTATNLAANAPTNGSREVFLRDVAAGTITWIPHSNSPPYTARWPRMSSDARYVLFKTEFPLNTSAAVVLYDRQAGVSAIVASNSRPAYPVSMSPDARFIAYDDNDQIYLWDRQSDTRTLVSAIPGSATSHSPRLSHDGAIVVFVSALTNAPFQIYCRNMTTGQIRRLTENSAGDPSSKDHDGSTVVVDPQGEFILFDSAEDRLVENDRNHASDIFAHTIATGETRLLSRAHSNAPALTPLNSSGITNLCVSADGNRILFFSQDSNLVPADTNGWQDAFLRDVATAQTVALSTDTNGAFLPMRSARHGILSADGRFALLGLVDYGSRFDMPGSSASIVRRDLQTGGTVILATNLPPVTTAFASGFASFAFSSSAEGQRVAYPSNGLIVLADMTVGTQTNLTASGSSSDPLISRDGRYVIYMNTGNGSLMIVDLVTGQRGTISTSYLRVASFSQNSEFVVYTLQGATGPALNRYSTSSRTNAPVCTNCSAPSISAEGRFVVYEKAIGNLRQVELKDMLTGQTTLITRDVSGIGAGNSETRRPVISADGRFIVYTTKATNLTTDPPNGWNNLYVYDRLQGTTLRIVGSAGNTGYGSGSASQPVLGPDGRTLVFQSFASDFVANDFNDTRDIFLLKLGEGDTDNDGMSDSWEQTHFSTTDRDGTGDYDQDGSTDLAEYLAGTNPNNNQSVLEVLQITSVSAGTRHLIWRAQPGKVYRVEYKTELAGAVWTSLGQVITASGPSASAVDPTAASERRFYRVALVQ